MKTSQALMVSLCCIGLAGCAGLSSRSTPASAPAPAIRAAAGPDQFAAPPPPPPVPQSTITVAPQKMYNMGTPKKSTAPAKSARPSAPARIEEESAPAEKPIKEEGASVAPKSDPAPAAAAPVEPAVEEPAAAAPAAGDPAAVARPVRKSEKSEEAAPQSSLKETDKSPVDVLPVSHPVSTKKIDTRMSS